MATETTVKTNQAERPGRIDAVTRLMSFGEEIGVSTMDSPLIAILRREPSGMTTTAFL